MIGLGKDSSGPEIGLRRNGEGGHQEPVKQAPNVSLTSGFPSAKPVIWAGPTGRTHIQHSLSSPLVCRPNRAAAS